MTPRRWTILLAAALANGFNVYMFWGEWPSLAILCVIFVAGIFLGLSAKKAFRQ